LSVAKQETREAAGPSHGTTLLFGLPGVRVARVEMSAHGTRVVHVVTDDPAASAYPSCGVFSTAVKGNVTTRPRDIPYGETGIAVIWHKRRWWCAEVACRRSSFTEQVAEIPARHRITGRVRRQIAHAVGDWNRSVSEAAGAFSVSWPTAHAVGVWNRSVSEAAGAFSVSWPTAHAVFVQVADRVLGEPDPTLVLGIDETRRGKPRWVGEPAWLSHTM
jgi:transposase